MSKNTDNKGCLSDLFVMLYLPFYVIAKLSLNAIFVNNYLQNCDI